MRGKAMKAATTTCMPRLVRGSCRTSTARPAASVSLLERIRDVVLRLIMLTAVSKASVQRSGGSSSRSKASSPRAGGRGREPAAAVTCRREESIRNEAVEECIEFLKRSSAEGDAVKLSNVTAETVAAAVAVAKEGHSPAKCLPSVDVAPETQTADVVVVVVAGVQAVGSSASPAI